MSSVDLSFVLKNLAFDKMNVDTKLAVQYLEDNKKGFTGSESSVNDSEGLECVLDSYGNKIYCDLKEIPHYKSKIYNRNLAQYSIECLEELAVLIEKETDLFCQLEYLIRKIPISDTKQSINLIVQYLRHTSDSIPLYAMDKVVLIDDSTPLLFLGSLCKLLASGCFTLIATKETAVICHLFTELCRSKSSCPRFIFQIGDIVPNKDSMSSLTTFEYSMTQITGIITERSDIESAVSAFLETDYHPFPIAQIMVQESIYADFKSIFTWKCKSMEEESKKINANIKSKCTDVFSYKKKLFLLDFAGKVEELNNEVKCAVFVEAYRTTTELLSLVKRSTKVNCVSLWASGLSEANEIALNIDVPFIWINGCCNFDGKEQISRVLFQNILVHPLEVCDESVTKLTQKLEIWSKKGFSQRYKELSNVINTFDAGLGKMFAEVYSILKIKNSVSVLKNTMILTIYHDHDVLGFTYDSYMHALKALVNGKAVIIDKISGIATDLFNSLTLADIPVVVIKRNNAETKTPKSKLRVGNVKIVWSNFGTKFAN